MIREKISIILYNHTVLTVIRYTNALLMTHLKQNKTFKSSYLKNQFQIYVVQ